MRTRITAAIGLAAFIVTLQATIALAASPPGKPQPWSPLTIHIVDKGIGQPWNKGAAMVQVDGTSNPRSIFGEAGRDTVHITVSMPSDQVLKSKPAAWLQQYIANQVRNQVATLAEGGARSFEIELIENINVLGYFSWWGLERQPKVMEFGKIAYGGISDAINSMRSRTTGIAVDATLGSNGTFTFAMAIEGWGGIRDLIQRVTMVDGRAWWTEMTQAIGVLGNEGGKVRIITSDHDFWAPASIANRFEESDMQKLFPNLTFLHVGASDDELLNAANPRDLWTIVDPFERHIRTMSDGTAQFTVRDRDNKVIAIATRREIYPLLSYSDYQTANGDLPTLGRPGGLPITPAGITLAPQQIQAAQADDAAAQFDITREFLVEFADNLKTFADFGNLLYDFRNLKLPRDASAATRAFFARIKPMQDWLARGGREVPDQHELLQKVYDVVSALREDLARPHTDPLVATLSSQTLQKLREMAFVWVTSNDTLQKFVDKGMISQPFAKYAGFLAFGADDLAQGIVRGVGSGNWQDPETVMHLLDAFNRGMWPQFPNKTRSALMHDRFCGPGRLRRSQVRVAYLLPPFRGTHGESGHDHVQPGRVGFA